jgi:hypothetical protein
VPASAVIGKFDIIPEAVLRKRRFEVPHSGQASFLDGFERVREQALLYVHRRSSPFSEEVLP